jgi:hypothetical protein
VNFDHPDSLETGPRRQLVFFFFQHSFFFSPILSPLLLPPSILVKFALSPTCLLISCLHFSACVPMCFSVDNLK